ncbi:589_t:CDS:2, partial [Cetraspora pellucida]
MVTQINIKFLDKNLLGSTSILANSGITNNTELVIFEINKETELSVEIEPNDESSLQLSACTSYMSWDLAEACLNSHAKAMVEEHNHQMQLDVILFAPKYRKLSSEILKAVEFYVTKEKIGAIYNIENKQLVNKKVRYANRFDKIKKALNIALDLGCEEELIDMITRFIDQKKSMLESTSDKNIHLDQSEQIIVIDPFVTKHHRWPSTRRLKGSSKIQGCKEPAHNNHAINLPDPNLRIPLSNASSNNSSYIVKE